MNPTVHIWNHEITKMKKESLSVQIHQILVCINVYLEIQVDILFLFYSSFMYTHTQLIEIQM